jgi:hypothetical protein
MSAPSTPTRKANGGKPKVVHRAPSKSRKPIPKIKVYVTKTDKDVLLGRGGESNGHPGNQLYLKEVKLLAKSYGEAASKADKTKISENVLQIVASQLDGRFIQKEEGTDSWFIAHKQAARDKASQASKRATAGTASAHNDRLNISFTLTVLCRFVSSLFLGTTGSVQEATRSRCVNIGSRSISIPWAS